MAYSIGIDFGTESGRVLLLDLATGQEVAKSVIPYAHGVIDLVLPGSDRELPPDWALQDPMDYIDVISLGIADVLHAEGVRAKEIIGLGVDFTSCTVLPVMGDGTPLCFMAEWRDHPHAWPKLWKHHAAQSIANRLTDRAEEMKESFLTRYGGKISSEWYFPKLLQIFEEDREVYEASYAFIEAADWIVWHMTGQENRNSCTAGFKAMWSENDGIPSNAFFESVNSNFKQPMEKLGNTFLPLGSLAGMLRKELAEGLGLPSNISVAVGNIDAHVSVPGAGVSRPGTLVMVIGTSICHLIATDVEVRLPGITGVVQNGVLPGYYGYEAGQAAAGDMLGWFVSKCISADYLLAAEKLGISSYEYLEGLAKQLIPGQSGIIALDWWNGNRSTIGDSDLSGFIMGVTLGTKPEEIYRALLESIVFGTRTIIANFINHDVTIDNLVACGGLPIRSPLLMQLYADICKLPVTVPRSSEVAARGAALFGAVAAGAQRGGFDSIEEASDKLKPETQVIYEPNDTVAGTYDRLYRVYEELYGLFGRDRQHLQHELKALRRETGFGG